MNICIFKGNLTRDPELTYTPRGSALCELSIAVNRVYYVEQEKKEEVTFVGVKFWGKQAEVVNSHFSKGSPILVHTRCTQESWDDKVTGQKRTKTCFVGESFDFCERRSGSGAGGAASPSTLPPSEQGRTPYRREERQALDDGMQTDDIPY